MEQATLEVTRSTEKNFGVVFAGVFCLLGLYFWYDDGGISWWPFIVAAVFGGLAYLAPGLLKYPNLYWFKLGMLLGAVVAPIVMALVYLTTLVPMGLFMRLARKDLLNLKLDKQRDSYWIKRETPLQPMKNQF